MMKGNAKLTKAELNKGRLYMVIDSEGDTCFYDFSKKETEKVRKLWRKP